MKCAVNLTNNMAKLSKNIKSKTKNQPTITQIYKI